MLAESEALTFRMHFIPNTYSYLNSAPMMRGVVMAYQLWGPVVIVGVVLCSPSSRDGTWYEQRANVRDLRFASLGFSSLVMLMIYRMLVSVVVVAWYVVVVVVVGG